MQRMENETCIQKNNGVFFCLNGNVKIYETDKYCNLHEKKMVIYFFFGIFKQKTCEKPTSIFMS
jgi:hypothetical protein